MKSIFRGLALFLAMLTAGCLAHDSRTAGDGSPGRPDADKVWATETTATPDRGFNHLFTRFSGGWTGGDGTYSVGLADGRTVWVFGDTFLGQVTADRTRSEDSPLINNCLVVQENDSLKTLHGGTVDSPAARVAPGDAAAWYWPADGTVEGPALLVFFRRFQRTGPDPWQYAWEGTDLAEFSLPGLALKSLTPLPWPHTVMYGSSILETPGAVYIYGTEDRGERKYAHLARARAGQLSGRWEFFSGAGWSADPDQSVRILEGVANQYSVLAIKDRYLLFTMDNRSPFSNLLVCYLGQHPHGPWQGPVTVYTPPEATGDVVAYNAFAHPQFTEDNRLLVSYNLNSVSDFSIPYADADAYRPRFIRVDLERLMGLFRDGGQETGMVKAER